MGKLAVKIVLPGDGSQPIGSYLGKSELVIADVNSSQPIPMRVADFIAAAANASAVYLELESGLDLFELEDGSGVLELES